MKKLILSLLTLFIISYSLHGATVSGFSNIIADEQPESYPSPDGGDPTIVVFSSIIDWNEQKVKVSAKTKLNISSDNIDEVKNTYVSLKVMALKKAVETIDNINIDSNYRIKDIKAKNKDFTVKLQNFITDATVYDLDRSYKDTGIMTCTVVVPIAGSYSLTSFLADNYLAQYFNFKFPELPDLFTAKLYAEESTGIIIDARDLKINPAVLPKVSTDKKDVYNPKQVNKKELGEKGAVQYAVVGSKVDVKMIKEEAAKQELAALKRTGPNPTIIKAYKTKGTLQTDAVISEKDAKTVQNSKALKEGKVTIIVDSRVGGTIGKIIGDYDIEFLSFGGF